MHCKNSFNACKPKKASSSPDCFKKPFRSRACVNFYGDGASIRLGAVALCNVLFTVELCRFQFSAQGIKERLEAISRDIGYEKNHGLTDLVVIKGHYVGRFCCAFNTNQ